MSDADLFRDLQGRSGPARQREGGSRKGDDSWLAVVIDDSIEDRAKVRRLLAAGSGRRYEFIDAETGEVGIRTILEVMDRGPACAILDHDLPDKSAVEVLTALSGSDGLPVCPVVVLTGGNDANVGRATLRAGAQDFIDKRWLTSEGLARVVENAVERHEIARELSRRAEELEQREKRFRLAARAVRAIVYEYGLQTKRAESFHGLEDLLGYDLNESVRGAEWWDEWIEPSDLEIRREGFASILADPREQTLQYRVRHRDGRILWVEERVTPVRDANGNVTRLVGSVVDVTDRKNAEMERKNAEEDLRRSHETFYSLIQHNPFGICVVDAEFRLRQVSMGAQSVLRSVGPLIGKDLGEVLQTIWPENFANEAIARLRHTLASGEPYASSNLVELRRDIGEVEAYDWRVERVTLPDGRDGLVCYFYDLSERQRLEAALRDREREIQTLADNSPDILTRFDRELRHVFVNAAVEKATGRKREEFLAKSNRELGMPSYNCDEWESVLLAVFESAQTQLIEFSYEAPDGKRYYSARLAPELGAGGKVEYVLGVTHDLTDQRRAEEALRAGEERLRMALAARAGVWDWEVLTGYVPWSSENYTLEWIDPSAGSPSYRSWAEMIHQDDLERVRAAFRDVLTGRSQEFRDEFRILHPTQGVRWILCIGRVELGPTGEPFRIVGINVDITERKQFEQALADQDRRKNEFLATLAHELRNPLAPIRNGIEVMKALPLLDDPIIIECREMMERQVTHMVRLVDDLLDVSRIGVGKLELRRELVQLSTVLQHSVESSLPLMEAARHALVIQAPNEPVWLNADLTRLSQVIGNLLNNAAKYTPEGGRIEISAAIEGEHVAIIVRDNGAGIPPEMLTKVFGMFTQVETGMNRVGGGLGIGLSLVKRLVEKHGGTIEAQSQGLGLGSQFIIHLPLARAPQELGAQRTLGMKRADTSPGGPTRILVVDDNKDAAKSMARLLTLWGYSVRIAHDGDEAIAIASDHLPELAFLDIGLPSIDGYELCRRLQSNPALKSMITIALTGWGSDEDKKRSNDAGFSRHLVKPIAPDQLEALLKEIRNRP